MTFAAEQFGSRRLGMANPLDRARVICGAVDVVGLETLVITGRPFLPRALACRLLPSKAADLPRHATSIRKWVAFHSFSNHGLQACKQSRHGSADVFHKSSGVRLVMIASHHVGDRNCPTSRRKISEGVLCRP